ncbi:hypothetical protein Purlil1_13010 [Purpureocillium lilacinum]|uniref:Uncharacterized protein n=1 Tax=Purpureocillium lilacinum TaxID=33203 RepID=A0ABR0BFW4_PURLI|nr:hypothetical protein Purlil1_13010 [Purpureocillium lilacinum]
MSHVITDDAVNTHTLCMAPSALASISWAQRYGTILDHIPSLSGMLAGDPSPSPRNTLADSPLFKLINSSDRMTDSGSFIKVPNAEEEERMRKAAEESQRKREEARKKRDMEEVMKRAADESLKRRKQGGGGGSGGTAAA